MPMAIISLIATEERSKCWRNTRFYLLVWNGSYDLYRCWLIDCLHGLFAQSTREE
jgi:hypothetical protein